MRLAAYRDFYKTVQRIRLLYEATMHSYHVLYESGRETLRDPAAKNEKIEFKLGDKVVKRPLRIVTYHARDVYPELLRSTLLVRLVAAYEAFVVEAVSEISSRSTKPFMNDGQLSFSQEQLLTIDLGDGIFKYIVQKTIRRLSGGGLKEHRKFFKQKIGIDLVADPPRFQLIEENHDRRHLFVHSSGYADAEYIRKHPSIGAVEGEKLLVPETYLIAAMEELNNSALHIKKQLEILFPSPPVRQYMKGDLALPEQPEKLQYICFRALSIADTKQFRDLSLEIGPNQKLRDIAVWTSCDGDQIRLLIGGTSEEMTAVGRLLNEAKKKGHVEMIDGFKVKR